MPSNTRLLLGLTSLRIVGGIAVVSRCSTRAFNSLASHDEVERVDRISLLDSSGGNGEFPCPPAGRGEALLSGGSTVRFTLQLWRQIHRHRPQIVFFDQLGVARSMLPSPRWARPRYAVFVHGIELDRALRGHRRRILTGAWRIVANSAFTAERIRREFPEAAENVRTALLCIDPGKIELWKASEAETPKRQEGAVLIVGRMWSEEPGKGHDALLACWARVRTEVPGAELWIVGDGDDRPRLQRKAMERGLGDGVRFLGAVSDEELSRIYDTASILAMPSRQEGFGLVYAEAMWHGLPCVGSTADAAGEVIGGREYGRLVSYGDSEALGTDLIELLSNPVELEQMRANCERRARKEFVYERFRADLLAAVDLG